MMLLLWITEVNLIVFFFLGICSLDGEFGVKIPNKKKGNGAMRMEERERDGLVYLTVSCAIQQHYKFQLLCSRFA
jgi:hypothetical protein